MVADVAADEAGMAVAKAMVVVEDVLDNVVISISVPAPVPAGKGTGTGADVVVSIVIFDDLNK